MYRIALLLALTYVAGCMAQQAQTSSSPSAMPVPSISWLANGRAIYMTGRDVAGVQIVATSHPLFGRCVACHRADGSGGKRVPDGTLSADLRHKALVVEQRHPYTLALLKRAISTGVDNEGKPLDPAMPRWKLSRTDLHDVAEYVLTQLK